MSFRIVLFLLILLVLDLYVFQGVKFLAANKSSQSQRILYLVYWGFTILFVAFILFVLFTGWHTWPKMIRSYSFALLVIIYLSKIFVTVFLLLDDVVRVVELAYNWIITRAHASTGNESNEAFRISRHSFLVKTGFVLAAVPFFSLLYGMINGAYNYRIHKLSVRFPSLPDAFAGLKIVQISDLHTGSFMGTKHLETAVELILKQKPDVIFFTGDLVNDRHVEALEFRETLAKLKAPIGVYSILGNHDYGDYYQWPSIEEKHENLEMLKQFQRDLGWKLLLNEHTYIEKDGEKIGLIGVENYSGHRNFSRYGDMKKSVAGFEKQAVNILLSHDPSHWDAEIKSTYPYVDLTLSGHTHGFQYGIEIGKIKWSPVQYMYKQWADLYEENGQKLYVNRGLGFIGYPGRVGILPEITVFTLQKA